MLEKRPEELAAIMGSTIFVDIKKAINHIARTSHCNILPADIVKKRFNVNLKNLKKKRLKRL